MIRSSVIVQTLTPSIYTHSQVAPYIQLNKSIRCDQMLLCLDNAISAGDEEVSVPDEAEDTCANSASISAKSSQREGEPDTHPPPPGTSSPSSKHRTGRNGSGSRPRHTETVVSSSDLDASDKWEQEPGLLGAPPVVKLKKEKG